MAIQRRERVPISVVIPAFNAERFVVEAVTSAWAQTRLPAEVIVVDDGSSDATAEAAERAGATVYRSENGGMCAARNIGIEAASQPWIAFLDADDVWAPEKIELQWAALEQAPNLGMAFCDGNAYRPPDVRWPSILNWPQFREYYARVIREEIVPGAVRCELQSLRTEFTAGTFLLGGSTMVVRRDLLRQVGCFDPRLRHWGDYDLTLRLLMLTSAAIVERPLFLYRLHDANNSQDKLGMKRDEVMFAEHLFAMPRRYPEEAFRHWELVHPRNLRTVTRMLLRRGRGAEARRYLRKLRRYGWTPAWELQRAVSHALDLGGDRILAVAKAVRNRLRRRPAAAQGEATSGRA